MHEEILVNQIHGEHRAAIVEDGLLQEIYIERSAKTRFVGNIYKGKVTRILPGMQAAFIDIGLERTAFLHASNIISHIKELPEETEKESSERITTLTEGQEIIVQVIKDPVGQKGARLTTQLSLASRKLVLIPNLKHIGVSLKIEQEEERNRLKQLLQDTLEPNYPNGFIIRTTAEGTDNFTMDLKLLMRLWNTVSQQLKVAKIGTLIYEDVSLPLRVIRDLLTVKTKKILVDSQATFQTVKEFMQKFVPESDCHVEFYCGERQLFDVYHIDDEIQKALHRKVTLKSGGYLVFDQTEAMTTIDVNTGGFVGHRNLDETIYKTNLEAAKCIARQLRVRNIGGIIIIDFIDMLNEQHKSHVVSTLEHSLSQDPIKSNISELSSLGLIEMTRKRTRESLEQLLSETCPICHGRGRIKTADTICYEIYREIIRLSKNFESEELLVLASQSVIDKFLDEHSPLIVEAQDISGKDIKFQAEILYSQEQYDVILL